MALALGTNCGFVTEAPTEDPGGIAVTMDGYNVTIKDTSPAGNNRIIEIGWWQDGTVTAVAGYTAGIYSDSDGSPGSIVGSVLSGQSVAENTAGWYKYTGLSIAIDASTVYHIAIGCSANGTASTNRSDGGGSYYWQSDADGTLESPSFGSANKINHILAFYAVYEAASSGLSIPVAQSIYRRRR